MTYYQVRQIELSERQDELEDAIGQLESQGLPNRPHSLGHWYRLQEGILYESGNWANQPQWYTEDMLYIGLVMELKEIPELIAKYAKTIDDLLNPNRQS